MRRHRHAPQHLCLASAADCWQILWSLTGLHVVVVVVVAGEGLLLPLTKGVRMLQGQIPTTKSKGVHLCVCVCMLITLHCGKSCELARPPYALLIHPTMRLASSICPYITPSSAPTALWDTHTNSIAIDSQLPAWPNPAVPTQTTASLALSSWSRPTIWLIHHPQLAPSQVVRRIQIERECPICHVPKLVQQWYTLNLQPHQQTIESNGSVICVTPSWLKDFFLQFPLSSRLALTRNSSCIVFNWINQFCRHIYRSHSLDVPHQHVYSVGRF